MTHEQAQALFSMMGKDSRMLERAAVGRDFRPVPLGARVAATLRNKIRTIKPDWNLSGAVQDLQLLIEIGQVNHPGPPPWLRKGT